MLENCVITYIFGNGKELLRDPLVTSDNVQYICVTDQPNLTSDTWKIVIDYMSHITNPRDKIAYVKFNPFKYTSANRICIIDGSMQISGDMNSLFNELDTCDLLVKRHPESSNLCDELHRWNTIRHMPSIITQIFNTMSMHDNIKLSNPFLIESCILGYKRTPAILKLCELVIQYMEFIGKKAGMKICPTNQCVLTYLIEKMHTPFKYINQSKYTTRYSHGSWKLNNH